MCQHHWKCELPSPIDQTVQGTCKHCGEQKVFRPSEYEYGLFEKNYPRETAREIRRTERELGLGTKGYGTAY